MRLLHIPLLISLCFLAACAQRSFQIGTVTIQQTTNTITLIQHNHTNVIERPELSLDYVSIITTPHIKYAGCDGVLELSQCNGLSPMPWVRAIRKSDFVLFPLFDKAPTCLGIMKGQAGASGGSSQDLIFLDTASNRHLELSTADMNNPVWIMGKDHPIGFKTFNYFYVGDHASSMGYKPRLEMIYSLVDGAFMPDPALLMAEARQCYTNLVFSGQERLMLGKTNWLEMDRGVAEKVLDAVYYGTLLGKRDEVNRLLNTVTPELRDEINKRIIRHIPTNAFDVISPQKAKLTAFEHRGNIFIKDQAEKVTRLTSSGKDRAPLISPDGKILAFCRTSTNRVINDMLDDAQQAEAPYAEQIWIVDLKTGKEKQLVSNEDESRIMPNRAFVFDFRFSPDGSNFYFLASAAPTTSDLYVIDIHTHKGRYVTHASSLDVISLLSKTAL